MTNTDSDNSREWAAQAYALLKKKQEEQKQELQKQEEQKQELIDSNKNILGSPQNIDEPELGEFDENFTWSAMVLAAQGKKINQISIDEIDWLTKLRRGLEETRKGFVTELLEKFGDDPLLNDLNLLTRLLFLLVIFKKVFSMSNLKNALSTIF